MKAEVAINMSKMIEDERNNEDTGCRRMAKFLAFYNFQARMIVVCVDAVMASNGGEPLEIAILVDILPRCFNSDFFSKKDEFRSEEILEWLDTLSSNGIFDLQRSTHLVGFRNNLDPSLLIKNSLEFIQKSSGDSDNLSACLSRICEYYLMTKESNAFKRAKKNRDNEV